MPLQSQTTKLLPRSPRAVQKWNGPASEHRAPLHWLHQRLRENYLRTILDRIHDFGRRLSWFFEISFSSLILWFFFWKQKEWWFLAECCYHYLLWEKNEVFALYYLKDNKSYARSKGWKGERGDTHHFERIFKKPCIFNSNKFHKTSQAQF